MTQREVFELVVRRLEELQISYMVCGSVGAMVYGEPRLTRDMDLVLALPPSKIQTFCRTSGQVLSFLQKAGWWCRHLDFLFLSR